MNQISFTVRGNPKAQPRPRAFAFRGIVRVYDPGTAEGWKSLVAEAAKPHLPKEPISGPVAVQCTFFIARPKSHYRGKVKELRADAPYWCLAKPDLDNLEKAVWDTLVTIGMLKNDSLIVRSWSEKPYSSTGSATIKIQVLL